MVKEDEMRSSMVDFVRLFFYLQTVRLVSKDGTERYEMQPNETVQDLKKKVQAATSQR